MSRSNPLFYGKNPALRGYGIIKDSMGLSRTSYLLQRAFQFEQTFDETQSKSNEKSF